MAVPIFFIAPDNLLSVFSLVSPTSSRELSNLSAAFSASPSLLLFSFNSLESLSISLATSFASLEFSPCVRYKSLYLFFKLDNSLSCLSTIFVTPSNVSPNFFALSLLNASTSPFPILEKADVILLCAFSLFCAVSSMFLLASLFSTTMRPINLKISTV